VWHLFTWWLDVNPSIKLIAFYSGNETFSPRGLIWTHPPLYAIFVWRTKWGTGVLLFGIIHSCVSSQSNYFRGLTHFNTELKFLLLLPLTQLLVFCLRDLFEGGYNPSSCWLRYQIRTWRWRGWIFCCAGCPCRLQYPFPCIGQGQIFEELRIKILCTLRYHIWTMHSTADSSFNL
jgi:hypothetical protein